MAELRAKGIKIQNGFWIFSVFFISAGFMTALPESGMKKGTARTHSPAAALLQLGQAHQILLPRLKGPVKLDGLSNEPAWQGIGSLSFVQMEPNFGAEPSERTEVLLAYNDDYLYMAGRLYDREQDKIFSNSKQRDSGNPAC